MEEKIVSFFGLCLSLEFVVYTFLKAHGMTELLDENCKSFVREEKNCFFL